MNDRLKDVLVRVPPGCESAKTYVLGVVFRDFFGLRYALTTNSGCDYEICFGDRTVVVSDIFLSKPENLNPDLSKVPQPPFQYFHASDDLDCCIRKGDSLPILFGVPEVQIEADMAMCRFDIFGTIFFFLSRFEEIAGHDRDSHDRFPAVASIAYRSNFLDRPIVDEYVELLWTLIQHVAPRATRVRRVAQVKVTCDVDQPFDDTMSSISGFSRAVTGDLVRRRSIRIARHRVAGFLGHMKGNFLADENYTFDWYMNVCEQCGRSATFFFIPDRSAGRIDGRYRLSNRSILNLIRLISHRGHGIGAHGSYNSYRDLDRIVAERGKLIQACRAAGVESQIVGNRQHYLRWDAARTPDYLNEAGYLYDSSGGFADAPGFRYGTSYPITMWSWRSLSALNLKQQPLVLMETTIKAPQYSQSARVDDPLQSIQGLKARAMKYGGDFTFLWHNSNLKTAEDRAVFQELLR